MCAALDCQLSFINARSCLRAFRGFMLWLRVGCQHPPHTPSPQGFALYSEPAFNIWADWRISWPVPRPGSGPATTRGLPPHTEEGREDGKKKGREGESMRQGMRGMEQIKNRCLYTCDSAFQKLSGDGAKCLWSRTIFSLYLLFAPRICVGRTVISYSPGDDKQPQLLSITLSHFPTYVDTPGNYPATFPPTSFPSSLVIRRDASERWR